MKDLESFDKKLTEEQTISAQVCQQSFYLFSRVFVLCLRTYEYKEAGGMENKIGYRLISYNCRISAWGQRIEDCW